MDENNINNFLKFYSIGEVSKMLNEAPSTLRYWEKEFEQIRPLTTDFGRRVYTQAHIDVITKIKTLLHEDGMTIKGAKNFLLKNINIEKSNENNNTNNTTDLQELKVKLNELLSYIRKDKQDN